ncbi:hypothetical protein PR048_020582 [Dryococelus australis]|uniref:Beta-glucuronidase n=1 Tax=Dryococelus australis TaxID=614101 RepID=A0ABQ9H6N4_9NEOP|nr:hypothetical protein PR048_020582 [Dryococelus australis]
MLRLSVFLLLVLFHWSASSTDDDVVGGILYPRPSESREVRSLDGLWNFRIPPDEERYKGVAEGWYKQELWKVGPTPISVVIRLESKGVTLRDAQRSITSIVGHHFRTIGDKANKLRLQTGDTIPMPVPASYNDIPTDVKYRRFFGLAWYQRDFFVPAAWSDRRVWVRFGSVFYAATVVSTMALLVQYEGVEKSEAIPTVSVSLYDKDENVVATSSGVEGRLEVSHAKFWWPYLMDSEPAYMYQLQVTVKGSETDVYRLPVGIRTVSWDTSKVYINGKQLYLRGFGRHEDSHVRGKGLDLPLVIRDYNLIRWIGANGYRTSHYPYSEEIMDFSDQQGIVIIDECPIVNAQSRLPGTRGRPTRRFFANWPALDCFLETPLLWSDELLKNHKRSLTELVRRDKNRPSVIMWSVANEAETELEQAVAYFNCDKSAKEHTHLLRPDKSDIMHKQ